MSLLLKGVFSMFLKPQTSEERAVILKFWTQHQDTLSIAGLLSRSEQYVERELHRALEVRRAEVVRCEKMIDQHVAEFVGWMRNHIAFLK